MNWFFLNSDWCNCDNMHPRCFNDGCPNWLCDQCNTLCRCKPCGDLFCKKCIDKHICRPKGDGTPGHSDSGEEQAAINTLGEDPVHAETSGAEEEGYDDDDQQLFWLEHRIVHSCGCSIQRSM